MISDMLDGSILMMFLYLWLILLLAVSWITATHFSGASVCINYSTSKIVQPKLFQTPVYKFLHTGFNRYFAPNLSSYSSSYHTRHSQSGGNYLVIPKCYPAVHKSFKQFGKSFAFNAPTIWNALPDEIFAMPSLASFRKHLKTYLYTKAYPP